MLLVDDLFDGSRYYHGPKKSQAAFVGSRNKDQWCHLTSDTSAQELHEFARRLGLKRSWFDGDHYDLTPNKRRIAIEMGAQAVTSEEIVRACRSVFPVGSR